MFRPHKRGLSGIVALAALLLAPVIAAAQFTPEAVLAQHDEADRAHDRAMAQGAWVAEASELAPVLAEAHRESADLRLLSDPRAVECNLVQANYLYLAGEAAEAMKSLMRAASIAMASGDRFSAVSAYIDAAGIAAENGWTGSAEWFASEARSIFERPGLSPEERAALERRL